MTFENVKKNYDRGLWGIQEVKLAVKKGVIDIAQFVEITQSSPEDLIGSLENIKAKKLNELSQACEDNITHGFDLETTAGIEHFSLEITDQLEITNLIKKVEMGVENVPYHSDGNACRLFTAEEMNSVAQMAEFIITYHRTYFNLLKQAVLSLQAVESVSSVEYGVSLPKGLDDTLVLITGISSIPLIEQESDVEEVESDDKEVESDIIPETEV